MLSDAGEVTAVDGQTVGTADQLADLIGSRSAGDSVSMSWTDADGVAHGVTVILGQGGIV